MICDIDGALLNFIDPMDLSAFFGNALYNAIGSAGALGAQAKPSIRARVYEKRGSILIEIGSCVGTPSLKNGLPRSAKGGALSRFRHEEHT